MIADQLTFVAEHGRIRVDLPRDDVYDVDLFAGGGGASEGFVMALGKPPDLAVNHNPHAIRMHEINHRHTEHRMESVFKVDPVEACKGRRPRLLWASPDCTHFSRAKGGKPREKSIRGLAWIVVEWAQAVAPRVICVENVPEFITWGPLTEAGQPDPKHAGETFREWVGQLQALGYVVEWKVLNAADHGAPTSRRRLFVVARCDGRPIGWPTPTHGPSARVPFRTAAECIDWSVPIPSIFMADGETSAWVKEARKLHPDAARPRRPLAEKTLRRVAEGIRRYVLGSRRPFLVNLTHGVRVESLDEPAKTITSANRGEKAVIAPTLVAFDHQGSGDRPVWPVDVPVGTVTAKARHAVAAVTLAQTGYSERAGQAPRALDVEKPLGTVVGGGQKHALVAAFVAKHNRGTTGQPCSEPLHTVTGTDTKSLVAAHLVRFYGSSTGEASLDDPLSTVRAQGTHTALVAAFLCKYYGSGGQWSGVDECLHTATGHARFSLVTVEIDGTEWAIVDIGMRMLTPRELARAQGFPDSYVMIGTKTEQVERIGNSVCPPIARALIAAQFPDVRTASRAEPMAAK